MRLGVADEDSVREIGIDLLLVRLVGRFHRLATEQPSNHAGRPGRSVTTGRDEFPGPRRSTL
ncbi:hypothetical protein CG717_29505 [Streptomyces sp. CB02613]|nr:hypothetical protein CG717_29505 [Streptomyces sp. CB02613]